MATQAAQIFANIFHVTFCMEYRKTLLSCFAQILLSGHMEYPANVATSVWKSIEKERLCPVYYSYTMSLH